MRSKLLPPLLASFSILIAACSGSTEAEILDKASTTQDVSFSVVEGVWRVTDARGIVLAPSVLLAANDQVTMRATAYAGPNVLFATVNKAGGTYSSRCVRASSNATDPLASCTGWMVGNYKFQSPSAGNVSVQVDPPGFAPQYWTGLTIAP